MSYRRFEDADGQTWEAWEVHPAAVERRVNQDRRAAARARHRRGSSEIRLVIPRELRGGWLALQNEEARLRISPIPDGWMHLDDDELGLLVERAKMRERRAS
jgi:hypothetical protein